MPLSREEVACIADYARIALAPAELDEMVTYMNEAIEMLEPIRRFDLEGVEPTFHPIGVLPNVMGQDVADDGARTLSLEDALRNAASVRGRLFRIPSILGGQGGDR